MIGRKVTHYDILDKVGEGGMGVVYRAEDSRLGRTVALKFLSPAAIGSDANRARLLNEARTAAGLQHPNICTVYDIDEADGQVFISMAYLNGQSLRDRLRAGALPVEEALRLVTGIARGLHEAHRKDIVHRDIKSANIIIDEHRQPVILDFGLATCATEQTLPLEGTAVGTVAYMSPEQARGEAVDGRSDLWSLGVCLYEMLTGQLPFRGEQDAAVIYAILNTAPTPPRELRPEVTAPLEKIVLCLLQKNPRERCRDAAALLGDLRALSSGATVPAAERVPSVAVLPFENMSADPEQDYFCAGIAEDILNDLTRIDGLRVAARTTSFAYRARYEDIRDMGRNIGVDTVLEGSVRKVGDQLRITAQLIDVETGYHIWSERWDRKYEDVFAIQDEISRSIVAALKVELTAAEQEELCRQGTTNLEAYDLYLRGRQYLYGGFRQVRSAREVFLKAIEKDPDFAQAHAGHAVACVFLTIAEPSQELFSAALEAGRHAIDLDPELAEAHAACAFACGAHGDFEGAEREYEIAMRLNPDLYDTYYFYARTSFTQGKLERATEMFEKAAEVNPSEYQATALAVTAYKALGQPARAETAATRALERISRHLALNPEDSRAICLGANALAMLGRAGEAIEWAQKAGELDPDDVWTMYNTACVFGILGEKDLAMANLTRAVDLGWAFRSWLVQDADFDLLRDEEAFQTLLERMEQPGR